MYPTLLLSHALFATLLLIRAGDRWFYRSWNLSLQHSAISTIRRERGRPSDVERIRRLYPRPSLLARLIGRPLAAISRKDFLTFIRERPNGCSSPSSSDCSPSTPPDCAK